MVVFVVVFVVVVVVGAEFCEVFLSEGVFLSDSIMWVVKVLVVG